MSLNVIEPRAECLEEYGHEGESGKRQETAAASTLIPSIFVGIAVLALRRSRVTALHFFHRAVLLSILFTEVFMF